ncbi:hypothetical protein JCM11251_005956 [Rhodosporidiobolus azoricus]
MDQQSGSLSLPLVRVEGTDRWEVSTHLAWGDKAVYKFVVDGQWLASHSAPTDTDGSGNVNNVLQVPPLALPLLTQDTLDDLPVQANLKLREGEREWRTVRLVRWTGSGFSLFAALAPSPALTFRTTRNALLPSLLEGGEDALPRSFAFARLPEMRLFAEGEEEEAVGEGTYVLVGADSVLPLPLKNFPSPIPVPSPPSVPTISTSPSLDFGQAHCPTQTLTTTFLSRLPRSGTRYFDFTDLDSADVSFSSSASEGGYAPSTYSISEFSDLEPGESRSRSASFSYPSPGEADADADEDEDEDDEDDVNMDARSDATFNTALSQGWSSSLAYVSGDQAVRSSSEGWTSGLAADADADAETSSGAEGVMDESVVPAPHAGPLPAEAGEEKETGRVYELAEGVRADEADQVVRAWDEAKVVFLPTSTSNAETHFLPLALHPSALPLLPLIRPSSTFSSQPLSTHSDAQALTESKVLSPETDTAQLPTPPATPVRKDGLALTPLCPSSSSSSSAAAGMTLSSEQMRKRVEEQLEKGLGRWVVVREMAEGTRDSKRSKTMDVGQTS